MARVEKEIDRLYELPLGEFTAERNELAKRLRKDGDREGADEVKGLKKPSEPAWAVNQLARSNRRELNALLRSGERLRDAQETAMRGGGRDELRAAIADEREQVAKLAGLAEPLLGTRPGPKLERVRAALHAAATDEATREAITAGRLVEDAEAIGLGPFELAEGAPAPRRRAGRAKPAKPKRKSKAEDKPRESKAAVAAARKALRALEAARKREQSARKELDTAKRELGRARDQAEEIARSLQGAERRFKEAEARESDATDKLAAAERAAREYA
jgi:hypothetical protein